MKKLILIIIGIIIAGLCVSLAQGDSYGKNTQAGKFASVNGIKLYYEVYGSGKPLLLLHGNGGSIAGRSNLIPELAKKYKVIAVDSRCHGKSGCSKELNYELMASDMNLLLNQLKIDSVYIWGHSDGGIVGLIMGYTYPDKVKKLVASGANIQPDHSALEPFIVEMMKNYRAIPDTLMQKHIRLMVEHPNIDFSELSRILAPVMIMTGDRDAVLLEHAVKIFKSIPNSNLCVLPATTHFIADEKPNLMLYWLKEFLDKPFSKPSTVDWARQAAAQLMPQVKR